jgi:invasion protein IalB
LIAASGVALAQQPKGGAPAAKGQQTAAAGQAAQGGPPASSWVKLCEKAPFVGKDKDGKEIKAERSICLTHHERIDATSGMVLVSAAVREIEGAPKKHLMVMLPLGMALPPGMQIGVYPKDMWEKIQKNEKVDDSKLKPIRLAYALCHSAGCTAEAEASEDAIKDLKAGAGMIVYALNGNGQPIAFPIPLNGFDQSLTGAPADNKEYGERRRALMEQIAKAQQQVIEDFRKQADQVDKMQGNSAQGIQPQKAAPAQAQPAPAQKK